VMETRFLEDIVELARVGTRERMNNLVQYRFGITIVNEGAVLLQKLANVSYRSQKDYYSTAVQELSMEVCTRIATKKTSILPWPRGVDNFVLNSSDPKGMPLENYLSGPTEVSDYMREIVCRSDIYKDLPICACFNLPDVNAFHGGQTSDVLDPMCLSVQCKGPQSYRPPSFSLRDCGTTAMITDEDDPEPTITAQDRLQAIRVTSVIKLSVYISTISVGVLLALFGLRRYAQSRSFGRVLTLAAALIVTGILLFVFVFEGDVVIDGIRNMDIDQNTVRYIWKPSTISTTFEPVESSRIEYASGILVRWDQPHTNIEMVSNNQRFQIYKLESLVEDT
jgi:hypothetical protein